MLAMRLDDVDQEGNIDEVDLMAASEMLPKEQATFEG